MDQPLYIQLKQILVSYEFNDQANFYQLFKFAKRAGLRTISFKLFCEYAKNMGVLSVVGRVDGVVKRQLLYDPHSDNYIKGLFPILDTCPNCKGSGIVEIKLS
jgi:hypothetical protein